MWLASSGIHSESVDNMVKELKQREIECEPVRLDTFTGKKMTFLPIPMDYPLKSTSSKTRLESTVVDSAYKTFWICKGIFESGRVLSTYHTHLNNFESISHSTKKVADIVNKAIKVIKK